MFQLQLSWPKAKQFQFHHILKQQCEGHVAQDLLGTIFMIIAHPFPRWYFGYRLDRASLTMSRGVICAHNLVLKECSHVNCFVKKATYHLRNVGNRYLTSKSHRVTYWSSWEIATAETVAFLKLVQMTRNS
jgi:hypothetical protein